MAEASIHAPACLTPAVRAQLDLMVDEVVALNATYQRVWPLAKRVRVAGTARVLSPGEKALVDTFDAIAGDVIATAERRAGARCALQVGRERNETYEA